MAYKVKKRCPVCNKVLNQETLTCVNPKCVMYVAPSDDSNDTAKTTATDSEEE